jgi:hypothetical protein
VLASTARRDTRKIENAPGSSEGVCLVMLRVIPKLFRARSSPGSLLINAIAGLFHC